VELGKEEETVCFGIWGKRKIKRCVQFGEWNGLVDGGGGKRVGGFLYEHARIENQSGGVENRNDQNGRVSDVK